jgi:hypothetical protein
MRIPLTFEDAFRGEQIEVSEVTETVVPVFPAAVFKVWKRIHDVAEVLEVTDSLVLELKNANLLRDEDVEIIKKKDRNLDKAMKLLSILISKQDANLTSICKILKADGQLRVVRMILQDVRRWMVEISPEELEHDLEKILEPTYGLLEKLCSVGVIEPNQRATILLQKPVNRRVSCLLNAVMQNWGSIKAKYFLETLEDEGQSHVVNFIVASGEVDSDCGDNRPLSEQQRRRLWCNKNVLEALDLGGDKLIELLQNRNVLSSSLLASVTSKKTHEERKKRLIRILERRSLADVKQFIAVLDEIDQKNVIQWLAEVGSVACIFTSIGIPEMSVEDKLKRERQFVRCFNVRGQSRKDELISTICGYMEKMGFEIMHVKMETHVVWYIMCRTVQALKNLRQLYESPSGQLANALQCIFNGSCGCNEDLQLSVEWSSEDFDSCCRFLTETSGRPFEVLKQDYEQSDSLEMMVKYSNKSFLELSFFELFQTS